MFFGMHALIYAKDAEKVRAFFRDVLKWPHVDAGQGWLIFDLPPAELGVHPIMEGDAESHQLYLMCKDVKKTVALLEKHGVQCAPIQDAGFGLLTSFELPGGGPFGMYQPRHPIAAGMGAKAAASKKRPAKKAAKKSAKKPAAKKSAKAKRKKR
jgi:predicted enzyme related to lactoylglutathione lyase